jgi:bifunctional non-homologous end joining protein LigD
MKKTMREGKVLVDWSQNDRHKTTVSVYSLRATERPMASAPVRWDEVEKGAAKRGRELGLTSDQVLKRIEADGDMFAPLLKLKQKLPHLSE